MGKLSTGVGLQGWPAAGVAVPTVELHHTTATGSWHVDWLIARDPSGSRPLITYRLPGPIREVPAGRAVEVERIADHRAIYLRFEGEIEGGRGTVCRISQGSLRVMSCDERELRIRIEWADSGPAMLVSLVERSSEGDCWQLRVIPATMSEERKETEPRAN